MSLESRDTERMLSAITDSTQRASVPQGNRSARRKKDRRRALPRYTESAALCGCSQMTDQPSTGLGKKAVGGTVDKALQTDGRGGVAGRRRETEARAPGPEGTPEAPET